MLPKTQLKQIKEELDTCKKPLIFFDDDPDGLCSFLQFYNYIGNGKGVILKTSPELGESFTRQVDEFNPDKVFVLDKPKVSQDFIDKVKQKIVWVDHHEPVKRINVKYFNPRLFNLRDNAATSSICYKVVMQDLWIAMVGTVGDWQLPDFTKEFIKKYPDLLPENVKTPEEALYSTKLGRLVRIFSFILKGKTHDVMKCVKILTRIKDPYEIIEKKTSQGKYIYKKYEAINKEYIELLNDVLSKVTKDKILIYLYEENKMSFTSDLSNELLFRFPEKIIIIGREKSGEIKMSIRSSKIILLPLIKKALRGVDGYGGGHEYACGTCVKKKDFEKFINQLKSSIFKTN